MATEGDDMLAGVDPLATLITNYLRCYTLPANYGDPLYGQTHSDVAANCGPLIAEVVREHIGEGGAVTGERCVVCHLTLGPGDGGLCHDHKYDEQRRP